MAIAEIQSSPQQSTLDGSVPRRRWLVVGLSALAGFLLTVVWSASFVDSVFF